MTRWILGALTFVFALLIGLSTVYLTTLQRFSETSTQQPDPVWISPVEEVAELPANLQLVEPPVFDDNLDYLKKSKVRLLFTGDFHDEEVPYRTGEKWIGLFRDGDEYELKKTTIVVQETKGEDLFSTNVSTKPRRKPLFLLNGNTGLELGKVSTTFDAEDHESFVIDNCNDLKSSFRIKGMFWRLCMENAPKGYPDKGTTLNLKGPGSETVLRSLPKGCNDCTWKLLWAGDLDNDTNLDLLIDVSDHYNVSQPTLFLSTKPDTVFATFRSVGC